MLSKDEAESRKESDFTFHNNEGRVDTSINSFWKYPNSKKLYRLILEIMFY